MSAHTPGPWSFAGPYNDGIIGSMQQPSFEVTSSDVSVAMIHYNRKDDEGREAARADARLIAAAPELLALAASIVLRGHATGCASVVSVDRPGARKAACDCLFGPAHAAVTKARGGK